MLSARIDIYIPTNLPKSDMVELKVASNMIDRFDGVTTINAKGLYKSIGGIVMADDVVVMYSYASALEWNQTELMDVARTLAEYVRDELEQECVLISVNNVGYLVGHEV
jgi:F0F1-type ATP synthase beta subunit